MTFKVSLKKSIDISNPDRNLNRSQRGSPSLREQPRTISQHEARARRRFATEAAAHRALSQTGATPPSQLDFSDLCYTLCSLPEITLIWLITTIVTIQQ
jgi:hypothetical protein